MKTIKKLMAVVAIAALCAIPVLADSYGTLGGASYADGVWTNGELVIGVTNGMEIGLTAENIVLVPFGSALAGTNTVTVRTPYQRLGLATLRVSTTATNKVKIAHAASTLNLGADWIGAAGASIQVYAPNDAFAAMVKGDRTVPTLTAERAVITATAVANGVTLNLLGIDMSTNAVKNVTNVVVTVVNGGLVVTNMTIALP